MIAIMGATGKVGGAVMRSLLARGVAVRALLRDAGRAGALRDGGAEFAVTDAADANALAEALSGCDAVFVMNPPTYTSLDMVADATAIGAAAAWAARQARVRRVVALSSVGAELPLGTGNIRTTRALELELRDAAPEICCLRAAWFLENWLGSAGAARAGGKLPSFLARTTYPIEMVATHDIGVMAAKLLTEETAPPVVELSGPRPYSPDGIAAAIRPGAQAVAVGAEGIRGFALSHGMSREAAEGWVEMVAGFDADRIRFTGRHDSRRGTTAAEEVLRA